MFNYSFFCRFLIWWRRVFVITIKEKIVGFISYMAIPFTSNLFCLQVCVAQGNRGKGIGVKLLTHLKAVGAKLHQARHVWCHTLKPKALIWFKNKMKWKVRGSAFGLSVIQSPEIEKEFLALPMLDSEEE